MSKHREPPIPLYALTGGIGAGKSTVAAMLKRHGCTIISADVLARRAVIRGSPALRLLTNEFGTSILTKDKRLNRKRLAKKIFNSPHLRRIAEKIIHQEVRRLFAMSVRRAYLRSPKQPIIYDVPLFFESKLPRASFHGVIVVYAPLNIAIQRAAKRMKLPESQILARARSQISPEKKKKWADFVVNNSSNSPDKLKAQVKKLYQLLTGAI